MKGYDKLECSAAEYESIQRVQFQNNTILQEQYHGSRKKLYHGDRMIATTAMSANLDFGGITNNQFNAFIGQFNKQLYKQFEQRPELYDLRVEFLGMSRSKNHAAWNAMPVGSIFHNIDIRSAYWQVAHKLGYLNSKMFKKYMFADEYKMAKRLCISFLARRNFMIYYLPDGSSYRVDCDTSVLKQAYQNIRNELYCVIASALAQNVEWLEYNIDGITVQDDLERVCKHFDTLGYEYKVTACTKLGRNEYLYGDRARTFTIQRKH